MIAPLFGSTYSDLDYKWRKSIGCQTIAFFFLFSNYFPIYSINVLAISRYDVIRQPLTSRFKDALFSFKIQILGFFPSLIMSTTLLTFYLNYDGDFQLQFGLCILVGKSQSGLIQSVVTISLVISQIISSCLIIIFYSQDRVSNQTNSLLIEGC